MSIVEDLNRLKQYALDNNLTDAQIQTATKVQVAAVLGRAIHPGYYRNLLQHVRKRVYAHREAIILKGLKEQLIGGSRTWLLNMFPKAEFNIRHRVVTLWLDGIPVEEEL